MTEYGSGSRGNPAGDKVRKQPDLAFGERVPAKDGNLPWHADPISGGDFAERFPTLAGQEGM